uniref:Uncharacterized protein n=1 Tax=Cryptomonas curvata TaxID=233186 RepID=A0A7S0MJI3_9CRYP|mmetsp:Transcript_44505/g.93098  ORF Transcript_44505/g.93098 Transcript_44505/m.93098 type:complete len:187 (+) Transcript_44505:25-585(+)
MLRLIGVAMLFSSNVLSVPVPLTEQTFCRPTRDSVFKHVLTDEKIRTSFICALSPFKNARTSDLMTGDLGPLAVDENLLNFLNRKDFQSFVNSAQHLELSCALFKSLSGSHDQKKLGPFSSLIAALAAKPAASEEDSQHLLEEHKALTLCQSFFAALRKKFELALLDDKKGVRYSLAPRYWRHCRS